MSLNVLILAEDITHDQHIVRPIIGGILAALGETRANVLPCLDPRFQGFSQATDPEALHQVYADYRGMVDCFVLCVDRDGQEGREDVLAKREEEAREKGTVLFSIAAYQEIETWALAGCSDFRPADFSYASWSEVRTDPDVKERGFEPFARRRNVITGVGGGRKTLGLEAGRAYATRVRRKCNELAALEARLRAWLAGR